MLIFEVIQDNLDLFFRTDVDLKIMLSTAFGVPALNVLAEHDQRHQENLNHVRNKQPEHEAHWRIELQRFRDHQIPTQPQDRPNKNEQKETERTNVLRDPYRKLIEGFHVAGVWLRIVTQRPSPFFKFFERSRPGTFIGRCGGAHGTISVLNLSTMLPLTSFCSQDRQPPNDRIKF